MDIEVKVRQRESALALTKRCLVRISDIGPAIASAFGEIYGYLGAHRVATSDPPFVIYTSMPGPDSPFEIEVCAPVRGAIDPPAAWRLTELPAGTFASTVHAGSYETLGQTYARFDAWLTDHGYAKAGPPREVYLSEPATPPDLTRTVIEYPVLTTVVEATTAR